VPLAAAFVLSALFLSGCAIDGTRSGTPPLTVALPSTCDRLLKAPALPPVTATDDARAAFVKDDAALIAARNTILRTRACLARQRALYAGTKK
jgi:hypothetical protein